MAAATSDGNTQTSNQKQHQPIAPKRQRTLDVGENNVDDDATSPNTGPPAQKLGFEDMLLPTAILRGLVYAGLVHPSPIQLRAIPVARLGFGFCRKYKVSLTLQRYYCASQVWNW